MDTRALQYFLHLANSLHFGRASKSAHISPSALSRSIRRLEEEAGAVLFERNNRSVSLTPAGRVFQEYARDALAQWEAVRNTLLESAGELHGEISMFCSVTASYSFLFDILTHFRQNHPQVEIKLHTGDPEEAMDRVLAGEEDISIGARPAHLPNTLAFRPIAVSPLVFISHRTQRPPGRVSGRPQAGAGKRDSFDWAVTPMILPERGVARNRADEWFQQRGIAPRIYAQVAGNEAIVSMVSLGFGVGVVPKIVLDNSPLGSQVSIVDAQPTLAPYQVGLFALQKRLSGPLIHAFWSLLQD